MLLRAPSVQHLILEDWLLEQNALTSVDRPIAAAQVGYSARRTGSRHFAVRSEPAHFTLALLREHRYSPCGVPAISYARGSYVAAVRTRSRGGSVVPARLRAFDDAWKDLRGDNMQMRYNTEVRKSLDQGTLEH